MTSRAGVPGRGGVGPLWLLALLSIVLAGCPAAPRPAPPTPPTKGAPEASIGGHTDATPTPSSSAPLTNSSNAPERKDASTAAGADAAMVMAYNKCLRAHYKSLEDGYAHTTRVLRWQLVESNIVFFLVIALVLVGVVFSWLQFRQSMEEARFRRSVVMSIAATGTVPLGAGAAKLSSGMTAPAPASQGPAVSPPEPPAAATGAPDGPIASPASTAGTPPASAPDQPVAEVPAASAGMGGAQAGAAVPDPCAVDMKLSPEGIEVHTSVLGVVILLISLAFFFLYLKYVYPVVLLPE